jgi:hypothetical protein
VTKYAEHPLAFNCDGNGQSVMLMTITDFVTIDMAYQPFILYSDCDVLLWLNIAMQQHVSAEI